MRKLVLGVLVGFLVAATAAWALDVTFPPRSKAQARVIVDELGNVLFGAMPAKVEVTNWPAPEDAGERWSVVLDGGSEVPLPIPVVTVPVGKRLVITDIDGSYQCIGTINGANVAGLACELKDSSGVRLNWSGNAPRSFSTGVEFGPGDVVLDASASAQYGRVFAPKITLMGRMLPASQRAQVVMRIRIVEGPGSRWEGSVVIDDAGFVIEGRGYSPLDDVRGIGIVEMTAEE